MFSILRKIRSIISDKQRKGIVKLFIITLLGSMFEVMSVSMMLPLVSVLINPEAVEGNDLYLKIKNFLGFNSYNAFILICIAVLIGLYIVKDLFVIFEYNYKANFIFSGLFEMRHRLFHYFLHQPYEKFLNVKSGDALRVITTDVNQVFTLLDTLLTMATELIISVALAVTVFVISPIMTGMMTVMLLLSMFIILKYVRPRLKEAGVENKKQLSINYKWILQGVVGIKEIKISETESYYEDMIKESAAKSIDAEKKNTIFSNVPRLIIEMVSVATALTVVGVMIAGGTAASSLIPALSALVMAAVRLLPSANRIVGAYNSVSFYGSAVDILMKDLAEYRIDVEDKNEECAPDFKIKEKLQLKDISYQYPNESAFVLKEANMIIPAGKTVGITGKSGAGKTTTIDILLGLLKPTSGVVLIDDNSLEKIKYSFMAKVSYIPQSIFLLDDTVRNNIVFGKKYSNDDKIWEALEEAQLADYIRGLPQGLDTELGERGIRLSGGQKQRIGIARALYNNSDIIVFDEATSALDNETEKEVMAAIDNFKGKKTLIIIAHRAQTIEYCDYVYRVENQKIELVRGE